MIQNLSVLQIILDFRIGLGLDGDRHLSIATAFSIEGVGRVDPVDASAALPSIYSRRGVSVSALAVPNSDLVLAFEDGEIWRVPISLEFEAWEFGDRSSGVRVVCSPGGELIEWRD